MDPDVEVISVPVERQELNIIVYDLQEKILKLCNLSEKPGTSGRNAKPCDIVDLTWLYKEKCGLIDSIQRETNKLETNLPSEEGELLDLYTTLSNENKQLEQTLHSIRDRASQLEEKSSEMDGMLNILKANKTTLETNTVKPPDMHNVDLLLRKSGEKLREVRNKFHEVLEDLFENPRTKDLIKDLTQAYFKGGEDMYIDLSKSEQYSIADIQILKNASLIVEHPYDYMKIKIDDIV